MIKTILYCLFITFYTFSLYGQNNPVLPKSDITGTIIDTIANIPLEYATISVFRHDSTLVTGAITDKNGFFTLKVDPGKYYIVIQFISYENKVISDLSITSGKQKISLGTIYLRSQAKSLDEVTVKGEKSEMVIGLDKKVFNVGKDLSNTGKSASDILDNIPSITVDLDGSVSLRGSSNLQILIDGKPSGLYNNENPEALKSLPGNMIESVEVITNPSAKYEAKGMAGIINIILKKDQKKGVNGSFEVNFGYPWETALSANVNFRKEKLNYFINYGIRNANRIGGGHSYQNFYNESGDTIKISNIERERNRSGFSNNFRGGADYLINDKNTLTAAAFIGLEKNNNVTDINYYDNFFSDTIPPVDSSSIRTDTEKEDEIDMEFSLNYEKRFQKKDHKLIAITKYTANSSKENSEISGYNLDPYHEQIDSTLNSQRASSNESEKDLLLQIDYTLPFGREGKFETGYRSEFRNIGNPFIVEEKNTENIWETLPNTSDTLKYTENIHALYLQAGNKYGGFSVQTGLRAELSEVKTQFEMTEKGNDTTYINLFPSIHLSYQLNDKNSLQLSYSRRINRPQFRMLNPFFSYSDNRNIRSGNPELRPEYTGSYEAGYLFNAKIVNFYSGLYYRRTTDVFEWVNMVDSSQITYQTPINLSVRQTFGLEGNLTVDPFKWWTLTASLNYYRNITEGKYGDQDLNSDDISWDSRLNSRMRFPKNFDIQAIFFYRGPQKTTQGERLSLYMLDLAISKDVLKGNGTLTLNIRDVLNSRKFRFIIDQPELYSENEFQWSQRTYAITFAYRLNQKKKMGRNGENRNQDNSGGDLMGF